MHAPAPGTSPPPPPTPCATRSALQASKALLIVIMIVGRHKELFAWLRAVRKLDAHAARCAPFFPLLCFLLFLSLTLTLVPLVCLFVCFLLPFPRLPSPPFRFECCVVPFHPRPGPPFAPRPSAAVAHSPFASASSHGSSGSASGFASAALASAFARLYGAPAAAAMATTGGLGGVGGVSGSSDGSGGGGMGGRLPRKPAAPAPAPRPPPHPHSQPYSQPYAYSTAYPYPYPYADPRGVQGPVAGQGLMRPPLRLHPLDPRHQHHHLTSAPWAESLPESLAESLAKSSANEPPAEVGRGRPAPPAAGNALRSLGGWGLDSRDSAAAPPPESLAGGGDIATYDGGGDDGRSDVTAGDDDGDDSGEGGGGGGGSPRPHRRWPQHRANDSAAFDASPFDPLLTAPTPGTPPLEESSAAAIPLRDRFGGVTQGGAAAGERGAGESLESPPESPPGARPRGGDSHGSAPGPGPGAASSADPAGSHKAAASAALVALLDPSEVSHLFETGRPVAAADPASSSKGKGPAGPRRPDAADSRATKGKGKGKGPTELFFSFPVDFSGMRKFGGGAGGGGGGPPQARQ